MIFRDRIYPWIKSIFGKKKPEQGADGVYAGPGYFEDETKKLYEGPSPDTESKPVEDVYAGPEYFESDPVEPEEGEDLPDASEEPEDGAGEDDRPVALLYAAPAYLADRPPQPPVMCVYAGPEFFAPKNEDGGFAPAPPPEEEKNDIADGGAGGPRCPFCGNAVPGDAPFCPECGKELKRDE